MIDNIRKINKSNSPDSVKLSEVLLLKIKNIILKQDSLESKMESLRAQILILEERQKLLNIERNQWCAETSNKLNVNINDYNINIETGECKKIDEEQDL